MKLVNLYFILFILTNTVFSIEVKHLPETSISSLLSFKDSQTQAVTELCSPYSTRSQLVNQQDLKYAQDLRKNVNSTIGIDGLAFFKLLANGQDSEAGQLITSNLSGIIIFGLQFVAGFLVLLLIWPFLLCCCLCSCCCCARQNKSAPKVLLIALSLALTLAIATSIYGLVETLSVGDSIQKAGCSAALIPDDILNGHPTSDGQQFFTGFYNINTQMGQLQSNLGNIASNFSTLMAGSSDPTMDNALSLCQAAKADTIKISSGDTAGSPLVLSYQTPINETTTTGSVQSIFTQIIGSYQTQSGLVWSIYLALDSLKQTLTSLRANSQSYSSQINNINDDIVSIQQSTSEIIAEIQRSDSTISDQLPQVKSWIKISDSSVKTYYGVVILFSALGILAAFCVTKSCGCRILLYISCYVLFFSAMIGFAVAVGFTFALPPLAWSCSFIEDSMINQSSFETNFNFLVDNKTLEDIGVCMPFGNGDILSKIGISAVAGINNLTAVIDELNQFDVNMYRKQIEGNFTIGLSYIREFTSSRIIDVTDSSSLSILSKISKPSLAGYQGCNANLDSDSWVPSDYPNSQYPVIICTSRSGGVGNETTCPNGIAEVGQCGGCMDSAQILNYYQRNPTSDLNADLASRYGGGCTFNQQLQNIWKNYYQIKASSLGPEVQGQISTVGVLPRTMAVQADINSLITQIDPALPNLFHNVLSGLSTINNLIDPKTGLLAGLNCRLMGEDFQRFEQSVCGSLFKDIYATRLALGIASYGILLSLCLFACVGGYRRLENKSLIEDTMQSGRYYAMDGYTPDYDPNYDPNYARNPHSKWARE